MGFFNAWQRLEALDVTPSEVVVALIDTGFNFQHEDIQGHHWSWGVVGVGGVVAKMMIWQDVSDISGIFGYPFEVCEFFSYQETSYRYN